LFTGRAQVELDLEDAPTVRGDMTRIGQVFINLLVNAAQAIPEGDPEHQRVYVSVGSAKGDRVVVTIRDTGTGMPPEVMRRIFEPFYTTKAVGAGTGLGLSVCKGIMNAVGGELTVESTPSEGSTFRVYLRAAHRPSRDIAERAQPTPRGRVLVVDDDEIVAKSMARMLADSHDVSVVTDSRAALNLLLQGNFDAVICDLLMPHLTGEQLYHRIAAASPEQAERFVFVSGAFTADASAFLARIPNPRLPKPPSMIELARSVRSVLLKSSSSGCHPIQLPEEIALPPASERASRR
jgi:CheY-like chemotaxis protein/anti-sigma regulatory factor (Ser/Thr protein kinase)